MLTKQTTNHEVNGSQASESKLMMLPPAILADNFETWMAAWTWKWGPERKKEVDLLLATRFPVPTGERVAQRVASLGLSTPTAPLTRRQRYLSQPTPQLTPSTSKTSSTSTSSNRSNSQADITFTTEYFVVKRSPRKGYGAFALKDIKKDTIIIAEAPLFRARLSEVFYELERLTKEQRQGYHTLAAFDDLAGGNKTLAIFKTNRFETCNGKGGIFFKSSRFNHACHPFRNCKYHYDQDQDLLVVTASQDIKNGQELTISYTSAPTTLPGNYGFFCDCPACPKPSVAKSIAKLCRGPE